MIKLDKEKSSMKNTNVAKFRNIIIAVVLTTLIKLLVNRLLKNIYKAIAKLD